MYKRETMRARALAVAAVSVCFGLAAPGAFAQSQAYTTEPTDLYAGPSGDYPVVSELGPNVPVTVMGCVSDYSWCDVALPDLRGWIYAGYLAYPYEGSYVPLESYAPTIGLPVVTFALGAYWGSFYRDRPWYGDRDRWAHTPPHFGGRPAGPPPMHGGPPPGMGHAPPMRGEPPPGAGHAPPPSAGGPPREMPREMPREAPRMPPQGNEARPAQPPMMNAPRRAEQPMARPSAPPQAVGRPSAPPAAAYGRGPSAQPYGAQRAPGPAPGGARPEGAPQGGHAPSQGNSGRNDYRQQN